MSKKAIWILLALAILCWALYWWTFYFDTIVKQTEEEHQSKITSNNTLNMEIDSIWNATSQELNDRLDFFEDYFQKKSEMYILEIFWLIEYALPDNNFVTSLSLNRNETQLSLTFSSPDIEDLLKLYRNLEKVKEMWIITEYSLDEIHLDSDEWLKSTEIKKYALNIWLKPNVTWWNEQIIEFLKKYDSYYRWIYTWSLKKIYCELYTTESWQQACKSEEQLALEKDNEDSIVWKLNNEEEVDVKEWSWTTAVTVDSWDIKVDNTNKNNTNKTKNTKETASDTTKKTNNTNTSTQKKTNTTNKTSN